jgi:FtsP/CotA-like multicopper oxidase with cupredoxin domain
MSKVGILVKDASGALRSVLYNDENTVGMKQVHDVDSIIPGTGKENLGKQEFTTGDTGVLVLGKTPDGYSSLKLNTNNELIVRNSVQGSLNSQTIISQDGTNEVVVINRKGTLYNIHIANTSSTFKFVKLYDNKDQFVAAMSIPKITIAVAPGNTTFDTSTFGIEFRTGISFAITGTYVDSDNTSVNAGDVILTVLYE